MEEMEEMETPRKYCVFYLRGGCEYDPELLSVVEHPIGAWDLIEAGDDYY